MKASLRGRMEFLRLFLRSMASLLGSGVPILKALGSLYPRQAESWAAQTLERIFVRVSSGEALSEAVKKEPKIFPKFVVSLIYVGEETAAVPENLEKAADYIEQSLAFKVKIYSALTYPFFLLGVMAFGTFMLLKYFLPAFQPVLERTDFTFSAPTRMLLDLAAVLGSPWFWLGVLAAGALLIHAYVQIRKDHEMRHRLDSFLLKVPGLGKILKSGLFAQLTRTLAAAYSSGISLSRGLALLEETAENEVFRQFIQDSRLAVAGGQELSEFFLRRDNLVPPVVGHLLAVGEKTGRIGLLLPKCTRLLEEETEFFLNQFFKFLEPGILVLMGILLALVAVGVLSPLYGTLEAVR